MSPAHWSPVSAEPSRRPTFDPEPLRGGLAAFLRQKGAGEDTEDLVQEAMLRAVRQPPAGSAKAWLFGIGLNQLRDRRRQGDRRERALRDLAQAAARPAEDPAARAESNELAARALAIAETLSPAQRAVLLLRIQGHFDYREIGAALSCSEATARQHFYLAMKAVRSALLGGGDDA